MLAKNNAVETKLDILHIAKSDFLLPTSCALGELFYSTCKVPQPEIRLWVKVSFSRNSDCELPVFRVPRPWERHSPAPWLQWAISSLSGWQERGSEGVRLTSRASEERWALLHSYARDKTRADVARCHMQRTMHQESGVLTASAERKGRHWEQSGGKGRRKSQWEQSWTLRRDLSCTDGLHEIASTEGECCVEGLAGLEHLRFMVFNHWSLTSIVN